MGFKKAFKAVATKYNNPVSIYAGVAGKAMQSKLMPTSVQKAGGLVSKAGSAYSQFGLNYAKQYAKTYVGDKMGSGASEYFETAQEYQSEMPSVSSGYNTTEYEETPIGLVPKVKGQADTTEVSTSTLILGGIALLFLASAFTKK